MLSKDRLAEIRRHQIEGRFARFRDDITHELERPDFADAPSDLKAVAYRFAARAAMLWAEEAEDLRQAKRYATLARELADDEPNNVLEADIVAQELDDEAALNVIRFFGFEATKARALHLFALRRFSEALSALEAVADGNANDADLHRVLAILRLASGQYVAAEKEIAVALHLDEKSLLVQQTAGLVGLISCYPPAFLPQNILIPVEPIPAEMMNRDPLRQRGLDHAVQHFDKAIASIDAEHPFLLMLELWRLAALSLNIHRKEDARKFAQELLYRTHPVDQAVQWSKMYGLEVHDSWERIAKAAIESGAERHLQRLMLGWLAIEDGNYNYAEELLMSPSKNELPHEQKERKLLLSRSFLEQQHHEEALHVLDDEVGTDVVRIQAYIKTLKAESLSKGAPLVLDAARVKAGEGDWKFVVARARQLLTEFPCRIAVRLVLLAYFNTKSYAEFFRLYDEAAAWTGLSADPAIRRAHGVALWQSGTRDLALTEIRRLFEDTSLAEVGLLYAHLLFEGGDTNTIASIVPRLRDAADLTPEIALQIAHALQSTHVHEAATLWDKAVDLGVPDEFVSQALAIAYRVGREHQTEELIHRMQALAVDRKFGITQANYHDVIKLVRERREQNDELGRKYRNGDIPIQILADAERLPLFVTHYIEPALNKSRAATSWNSIYVRAGNRGALGLPVEGRVLLVDATSLILAHYLDVMQPLLDATEKVVVPAQTVALLHAMHERISASQPGLEKYFDHLLGAIDGHAISVVSKQNQFEWALNAGGYAVTSLPPFDVRANRFEDLDPRFKDVAINLRRLVETLSAQNLLSSWDRDAALRILGSTGLADPRGPIPERGAKLLFDAAHVELMQQAQLIRPLFDGGYQLFITTDTRSYLEARAQEFKVRSEAADKLKQLIDNVGDAVSASRIELRRTSEDLYLLEENAKASASLLSLATANEVLTVDDRFMNRLTVTESGAPVVSLFDCIAGMREALGPDRYYQALNLARGSGLLFIPIATDEILYLLGKAATRDGVLAETNELLTLRRYIAAALSQPGIHLVPQGAYDERPFLRALDASLTEAVLKTNGDSARREYLVEKLEAAEVSAIRQQLDSEQYEAGLRSLEALISRLALVS